MKLATIYEAYDKNLGNSIAKKHGLEPAEIKAWVQAIDPNYTYAPWILKQLKDTTPTSQLQDELKELTTKFQNATEYSAETLISTDINQYTLESLRSALDTYKVKGEFQPESLSGVKKLRDFNVTNGFGATEGVETRIRAYAITDPTSLAQLSKGRGWCVRNIYQAVDQITKTPVIMIFRNNEATALGDIIGPQLMNSQNIKENRAEVIKLMKEIKDDNDLLELLNKDAEWACRYARDVIKGRWPEGERAIIKSPSWAYDYAQDVIKGRWPEAEPAISKNPGLAYLYASNVIKGRWPEAEPAISKDPQLAYEYALNVIKGRWPEAEQTIIKDPGYAYAYARDTIKGRWPEGEPTISTDPHWAYLYAKGVIKGRWPEAEPAISKDPHLAYPYALYIIKGPWPEAGIK